MRADTFHAARAAGQVRAHDRTTTGRLSTASGSDLPVLGRYYINTKINNTNYTDVFLVTKNLCSPAIIGMPGIKALGILYHPIKEAFSFADSPDTFTKSEIAAVNVARDQEVPPHNARSVRMKVCAVDGSDWFNQDLVANIAAQDVLVRTDSTGHFNLPLSNTTDKTHTWKHTKQLGVAMPISSFTIARDLPQDLVASSLQETRAQAQAAAKGQRQPKEDPRFNMTITQQIDQAVTHLTGPTRTTLRDILRKHAGSISANKFDLGRTPLHEHSITLHDHTPVYKKQFPIPLAHTTDIQEQMRQWLKQGVIEPTISPYNSPLFCVQKKGGAGFRLCLDYRALNEKTVTEEYLIRTADDCMAEVGQNGGRFFIALDLSAGFYQMPLRRRDRRFTAFTVPGFGQMQWNRAAMGLKGCPASFQRLMDMALKDIKNIIIYIDDILIYGPTQQQTLDTLAQVMRRLGQHNLKINLSKSVFLRKETAYLGHTLTSGGITPALDKLKAIREAPPPTSQKQLKSFLGLTNYFRSYMPNYAKKAGKLYALTRRDSTWRGGQLPPHAKASFLEVRNAVADITAKSFPTADGVFHLFVDASMGDENEEGGLGGYLAQDQTPTWTSGTRRYQMPTDTTRLKPIAFSSRQLKRHEKNYCAFLLELQSAVFATDSFSHYLMGRHFILHTDHAPLQALSTVHRRTLHRLHDLMMEHDFTVRHIPGKENAVADYLSRSLTTDASHDGVAVVVPSGEDMSTSKLAQLQREDQTIGPIYQAIKARARPPQATPPVWRRHWPILQLHGGVLHIKLRPRPGVHNDHKLRAIVPESLRAFFITQAHDSALAGHQGILKTEERIKERFFWPGLENDVRQHLKHCQTCQATSTKDTVPNPAPQAIPPPKGPNQRIHIDLFGPITASDNQSTKFVLGITDAFTKILALRTIPSKDAIEVARGILDGWICIYGTPLVIVSDNGREFCNALEKAMWELLHIDHRTTTPFHPRCNMQQERQHSTLAHYMRCVLRDAERSTIEWEYYLPLLTMAVNTSVNKHTRMSPFYAMFGHDARLPLWTPAEDIFVDKVLKNTSGSQRDILWEWNDIRRSAQRSVHTNLQRAHAEADHADLARPGTASYRPGQTVWIRILPLKATNRKFASKFEKAIIKERVHRDTYKVKREAAGGKKFHTVNAEHIKPRYTGFDAPDGEDMPEEEEDNSEAEDEPNEDEATDPDFIPSSQPGTSQGTQARVLRPRHQQTEVVEAIHETQGLASALAARRQRDPRLLALLGQEVCALQFLLDNQWGTLEETIRSRASFSVQELKALLARLAQDPAPPHRLAFSQFPPWGEERPPAAPPQPPQQPPPAAQAPQPAQPQPLPQPPAHPQGPPPLQPLQPPLPPIPQPHPLIMPFLPYTWPPPILTPPPPPPPAMQDETMHMPPPPPMPEPHAPRRPHYADVYPPDHPFAQDTHMRSDPRPPPPDRPASPREHTPKIRRRHPTPPQPPKPAPRPSTEGRTRRTSGRTRTPTQRPSTGPTTSIRPPTPTQEVMPKSPPQELPAQPQPEPPKQDQGEQGRPVVAHQPRRPPPLNLDLPPPSAPRRRSSRRRPHPPDTPRPTTSTRPPSAPRTSRRQPPHKARAEDNPQTPRIPPPPNLARPVIPRSRETNQQADAAQQAIRAYDELFRMAWETYQRHADQATPDAFDSPNGRREWRRQHALYFAAVNPPLHTQGVRAAGQFQARWHRQLAAPAHLLPNIRPTTDSSAISGLPQLDNYRYG